MKKTFQALNHALSFARFSEPDIKHELLKLVNVLQSDLEMLDYEPSSTVEAAVNSLQETLDELEKREADEIEVVPPTKKSSDVIEEDEEDEDLPQPPTRVIEDDEEPDVIVENPDEVKKIGPVNPDEEDENV